MPGNTARTGDRYRTQGIIITVGEVDPGGRWASIHCLIPPSDTRGALTFSGHEWDKQQPLTDGRLPDRWVPLPPPPPGDQAGLHECGKADCPRLVSPASVFCCAPCAEASAGGYETGAHSQGCDERAAQRRS